MPNEEFRNAEYSTPIVEETVATSPVPVQPTPNNPPWNSPAAIGVWLASVLFIVISPVIFVIPYIKQQNLPVTDQAEALKFIQNDPTAILLQLFAVLPAHLLTLVLAWIVATRINKFSFRETLGWNWGGFKIWYTIPTVLVFFALMIGVNALFGSQENEMDKILKSSRYAVFLVAFFATFTAPLVEEVVYRGILYSALQRTFGVVLAVVGVTVLFAAIHIPQYSSGGNPDYATISVLLLLSLVLTLIRVKTGNLLPCIVLHTVFNGVQAVLLILQPYLPPDPTLNPEQVGAIFHLFK